MYMIGIQLATTILCWLKKFLSINGCNSKKRIQLNIASEKQFVRSKTKKLKENTLQSKDLNLCFLYTARVFEYKIAAPRNNIFDKKRKLGKANTDKVI